MEYRKEIDGLRAIAVIPVILFHAGFSLFSGGFVGVDIFFVISGYLITTIILTEKEKGIFSLVNFYERRARRIIPALFIVMLVSVVFSWFWLLPSHMMDFSESLIAISLFSSNFLFLSETGYWGVENELKPMLHTWSLAVEEQYYMLFPIFLMMMWRYSKRWIFSSFIVIAIGSLFLSQWASINHPTANFFLLPTRGWELAIGASIAFYFLYRKNIMRELLSYKLIDEVLGILGLGLILYAVLVFDENIPFPSFYALIPTIGTALIIIFASNKTVIGRFLGSKLLVKIGLISYSSYLWHQPLFVFVRQRSFQEPTFLLYTILSISSLILGFISWKYIEAPFRNKVIFTRKQIFLFTSLGSVFFVVFGFIGHFTEGYKFRVDSKLSTLVNEAKQKSSNKELCEQGTKTLFQGNSHCILVKSDDKYVFLYGDSHAKSLMLEAKNAFSKTNYGLLFASTSACPPVKNIYRADSSNKHSCFEKNNNIYEFIKVNKNIDYVILVARWTLGMEGSRFNNFEGGIEHGRKPHLDIVKNGEYQYHADYNHRELIAQAYMASIQELIDARKKVILIYPTPEAGWNVPDYIQRFGFLKPNEEIFETTASTKYDVFKKRNMRAINALDKIPPNDNLVRIYPERIFCNNTIPDRCITYNDGSIYYRDDDHLSDSGARLILNNILNYL